MVVKNRAGLRLSSEIYVAHATSANAGWRRCDHMPSNLDMMMVGKRMVMALIK